MVMTKSYRETADGHDQEKERQSMVMANERERSCSWPRARERQSMAMTR